MRLTIAAAVACLVGGVSLGDEARAAMRRTTNIPAQNLGEALQTLAKDHGVQVVYFSATIDDARTAGAVGELTTNEAFEKILSGTGFTYRYLGEKTITIVPIVTGPPADLRHTTQDASSDAPRAHRTADLDGSFRLAQAQLPASSSSNRPQSERDAEGGAERASSNVVRLEEVTVTGTHIRGAENITAPVVVLDREYIDSTGLTTAVQLVESLPQNFALANQSTAGGLLSGTSLSTVQGSTINLRGIGEGTTLTLVNGRRMPLGYDGSAVNIAALPLSAIERVEILTDGASALYGSDAVGGVVNFILRNDFDGAETRAKLGTADDTDELRLSQTFGHNWESGNFVASAEHYRRDMLDASDRRFGPGPATTVGSLLPEEDNLAATFFGQQDITSNLEVFADVLYTDRDSVNRSSHIVPTTARTIHIDNSQLSATAGFGWAVGSSWRVELTGGYGEDDMLFHQDDPLSMTSRSTDAPIVAKFTGTDFKADGALFDLPGGAVRLAVGAHWREESISSWSVNRTATGATGSSFSFEKERNVSSLFVESLVPLVGAGNAVSGIARLDLSLAGRFDDYSDFGSSVDPRIGLAWMPIDSLKLRGSWGTSYLAPKLKDYDVSFNAMVAFLNYAPAGGLHTLALGGNDPESLKAQESENYTLGLDWQPTFLPGATFSLNYYNIDYRDKIDRVTAHPLTMLADPASYGDVFILDPTVEQVQALISEWGSVGQGFRPINPNNTPNLNFDPATVDLIVDSRRRNIGVLKSSGFDVAASYAFEALGGNMQLALDVSYIDELVRQVTATSAPIDQLDTYLNPTHLRVRGHVGYRHGGWSFNAFVHRKNSYTDNRIPNVFAKIDNYTTLDTNIGYRFGDDRGVLSNVSVVLGAINVLDEDPPYVAVRPTTSQYDLGFDATNASPLGRLVTLDVSKTW